MERPSGSLSQVAVLWYGPVAAVGTARRAWGVAADGLQRPLLRRSRFRQQVKIVGVPDARLQEVACACVVLVPGAQVEASDLIAFCRGKVASFKVPRHVLCMKEYPMTASGKVQKFKLRALSIQALDRPQA
jgi:non-ribosomal peptide synthetase component E (peptide arylation enzyme)